MEISPTDLINKSFEVCAKADVPAQFPSNNDILIFYHKFQIGNCGIGNGEWAIDVSLVKSGNGTLAINAPKDAVNTFSPPNKRTALARLRAKRAKHYLAEINNVNLREAELCMEVRSAKIKIPIANVYGPFLFKRKSGLVELEFGLSLVPDAMVGGHHQYTALKVLALAAKDESLIDPKRFTASPVDLLRAITKLPVENPPEINPPGLKTNLLPFQRESIGWCLKREGKNLIDDHNVENLDESIRDKVISPPLGWRRLDSGVWINPYLLRVSSLEPEGSSLSFELDSLGVRYYKGRGLLSEEMGLGKSMEVISLSLLNRRPGYDHRTIFSNAEGIEIIRSKATLVIAPRSILWQWKDEVSVFAPSLNAVVINEETPTNDIIDADMAFISYQTLAKLFPRGKASTFKSILARIQFWRVVLDEVQMVSTGASTAAQAARKIQRIHAWAVSGTPTKRKLEDLRGITYFLDLQPFVENPCWQRLISSSVDFEDTMRIVGLRHTKPMVANQLDIPRQHRNLMMLKLSVVERLKYDRAYDRFREMSKSSSSCNWNTWLKIMRTAYFSTAGLESKNSTTGVNVVSMSLDEVLDQLIDQADAAVWDEIRESITAHLELGQLFDQAYKMPKALEIWKSMVPEILGHIESTEVKINEIKTKIDVERHKVEVENGDVEEFDKDSRSTLSILTAKLKPLNVHINTLKDMLHMSYFFLGTGYFRTSQRIRLALSEEECETDDIKAEFHKNSLEETKYYDLADNVRNDILGELEKSVLQHIKRAESSKLQFMKTDDLCSMPLTKVLDELSQFCSELATRLLKLLSSPLMEKNVSHATDGIKPEDDYYSKTLDTQGDSHAFLEILQMLLRDRASVINGSFRSIPNRADPNDSDETKALTLKRSEILEKLKQYVRPDQPVLSIVRMSKGGIKAADKLRAEIHNSQQNYGVLANLYNARLVYYKQLQDLSDHVEDIEVSKNSDLEVLIQNKERKILDIERRLRDKIKRQRYVRDLVGENHAKTQKKDSNSDDLLNNCVICFDSITEGALTPCGHTFCDECISRWVRVHPSCPVCRQPLKPTDIQKFINGSHYSENKLSDSKTSSDQSSDFSHSLFRPIKSSLYNRIHGISIARESGVKIDMVVRTVIYLREQNPATQIIVFSQYLSQLKVMYTSFIENGIKVATCTQLSNKSNTGVDQFRIDPSIACLLLHTKNDVSGLTLVNANHIILCEPLMNTALELQAVSRIDRIGQRQETYVWQFCVEDTVEQSILSTTTRERMLQTVSDNDLENSYPRNAGEAGPKSMVGDLGEEIIKDEQRIKDVLFFKHRQ